MKKLSTALLSLFLSCVAGAQTTTVAQQVVGPDGGPGNGTASISINAVCTADGRRVSTNTKSVTFLAGAFSTPLVPNDNCSPANTSYTVTWAVCGDQTGATLLKPCPKGGASQWTESWGVPASDTPLTVDDVILSTTPVPPQVKISLRNLNATSYPTGHYCVDVTTIGGIGIITGLSVCNGSGGGGSNVLWTSFTNTQWTTLTNAQWTALSN